MSAARASRGAAPRASEARRAGSHAAGPHAGATRAAGLRASESRAAGSRASGVRDAAPLFAALGDDTRLRLVARLSAGGPASGAQLAASSSVSRQACAKHLELLSSVGLVDSDRRGRERIWTLVPRRLADAHEFLDSISAQWDDALARLARFVEQDDAPRG